MPDNTFWIQRGTLPDLVSKLSFFLSRYFVSLAVTRHEKDFGCCERINTDHSRLDLTLQKIQRIDNGASFDLKVLFRTFPELQSKD